jgi:hypothetical protein
MDPNELSDTCQIHMANAQSLPDQEGNIGSASQLPTDGGVPQIAGLLWRLRFTVTMLISLGVAALLTDSHTGKLPSLWLHRLGFAPLDLRHQRWDHLFTSALVTGGGRFFAGTMGMVVLTSGLAEWIAGTRRTVFTFWGVHVTTLLAQSLLVAFPLHWLNLSLGNTLYRVQDVGPSAGYFGALGLISGRLPGPWRWLSAMGVWGALLVALWIPARTDEDAGRKLTSDLTHVIAFPLGWASTLLLRGRAESSQQ